MGRKKKEVTPAGHPFPFAYPTFSDFVAAAPVLIRRIRTGEGGYAHPANAGYVMQGYAMSHIPHDEEGGRAVQAAVLSEPVLSREELCLAIEEVCACDETKAMAKGGGMWLKIAEALAKILLELFLSKQ